MNKNRYSLTFACYNQVEYTRKCIDSMLKYGMPLDRLVVIDNASTDGTRDYLETLPLGGRIYNRENLGCGVAWNQGALLQQAYWTIVMNNDVLVSADWIESLLNTAEQHGLKVISPAVIEGPLDYDFDACAPQWGAAMKGALRLGWRHAVCVAVHKSVWLDVGYFQPIPKLFGYEDTIFFNELDKAKIPCAMTGASWLHHYGSMTLSAMKKERGLAERAGLSDRKSYRALHQSWLTRKVRKFKRKQMLRGWREQELASYGMSMHGLRKNLEFEWI
jgi:N-acetylglucosaminyl-diphospho-decaprenol L-rhamnosyltransferase